jgi:hypothetical protein
VSLIVTSVLVAGGVLLGRWIARGGRSTPDEGDEDGAAPNGAPEPPDADGDAHGEPAVRETPKVAKGTAPARDPFSEMPCTLGDVVMRGNEEAWLAGGVVFIEQHPVSALFVAPDAGAGHAIYARARPSRELFWLTPLPAGEVTVGAEPPTSLEHASVRYDRLRRLPVKVQRAGSGAPDVGDQVIVAEYASSGFERLVVVTGAGTARVWAGLVLEEGMYEVLPSGKSTLED